MSNATCAHPGCLEVPRPRTAKTGNFPKFCCDHDRRYVARLPLPQRTCPACGADISHRRRDVRYCDTFCADVNRGRRVRTTPFPECVCDLDGCDVIIPAGLKVKRFCCNKHERQAWRRAQVASGRSFYVWTESTKARSQRRRAIRRGATVGNRFTSREIFERDGWICYLCERAVDRTLKHPDPESASLEHVIPLSRGGEHSQANVRLAHLHCNLTKRDRLPPGVVMDLPVPPPIVRQRRSRVRPAPRRAIDMAALKPNLARIYAEAMEMRATYEGAMPPG